MIMNYFLALLIFSLTCAGCAPSAAGLNSMAQNALRTHAILKEQARDLDQKFLGADKEAVLAAFGKPRKMSQEPYPYRIDPSCIGKDCVTDYSDEIWFYEFKGKFESGWEAYSLYVYFKNEKVVRIR